MDSARPEVLDFYRQQGAEVIDLSEDQDSTDLHKCLAYIEQHFSREQLQNLHILVVGVLIYIMSSIIIIRLPLLNDCSTACRA
jgi:thiamine pyrophosphokinase